MTCEKDSDMTNDMAKKDEQEKRARKKAEELIRESFEKIIQHKEAIPSKN